MSPGLKSACFACVRYLADDGLAKLMAHISWAPYVAYLWLGALAHSTRDVTAVVIAVGGLANAYVSMAAKRHFRHPRPPGACARLGMCSFGMPSSHSQVMGYVTATALLMHVHRRVRRRAAGQLGRLSEGVEVAELVGLSALTAAVGYSRVYLGYHTAGQVAAGIALGAAFAAAWVWGWAAAQRAGAGAALCRALAPLAKARDAWAEPYVHHGHQERPRGKAE